MPTQPILLITPPFTQINTPYPATTYLKGFLNTRQIPAFQADLGIEAILRIFSSSGLQLLFDAAEQKRESLNPNGLRMLALRADYIATINSVIRFLQHKNPTLAYNISEGDFLPQASRFDQLDDLEWAFGSMGIQDRARHLATLYLEDLGDLIQSAVDPHFGFSRYAERLASSATSFDKIKEALDAPPGFVDGFLTDLLEDKIQIHQPKMVCLSVPFPGNLYGALRCGKYIKEKYPEIVVVMGGGYPNTELRSLADPRVFDHLDFITLDDGERPLLCLLEMLDKKRDATQLKRTFARQDGQLVYINNAKEPDFPFNQTGTPDYSDLMTDQYLSVIEVANPMHRLWSDGRWNKLTMAHGCYWKKCSFCDISLDYIKNYEPVSASLLCDRMEEMIVTTGETGFHFVDEAAPPALMRELALEILRRKLVVTWWANIRFEKRFTADLCRLLKASGCIAVSGGLEVASDRLLERMKKGVTVTQVAQVAHSFTSAGIMVHAYLMYGFPTQTAQETIDSLEMVRQLFANGAIQSGFWHLFAMTAHSPIGLNPEAYGVVYAGPEKGDFANNDLVHEDPTGCDHLLFGEGLKKALFNYMHGVGTDFPLQKWFDFKVPSTTVPRKYIEKAILERENMPPKDTAQLVWLGNLPQTSIQLKHKKGKPSKWLQLKFTNRSHSFTIVTNEAEGAWLDSIFPDLQSRTEKRLTLTDILHSYTACGLPDFQKFMQSPTWIDLRNQGLLLI